LQDEILIDFEKKNWDRIDEERAKKIETDFFHPDIERENKRKKWEESIQNAKIEEENESNKRFERRILLNQIISETQEGRDKVQLLQNERLLKIEQRKEQIQKQAELQKIRKIAIEKQKEAEQNALLNQQLHDQMEAKKKKIKLKTPSNNNNNNNVRI